MFIFSQICSSIHCDSLSICRYIRFHDPRLVVKPTKNGNSSYNFYKDKKQIRLIYITNATVLNIQSTFLRQTNIEISQKKLDYTTVADQLKCMSVSCNGRCHATCVVSRLPVLYCRPSPRKIYNIADLPPEDLQHCRPSPKGRVCNIADLPPFHCRSSPGEDLQHCKPSSIFVMFRILIFGYIEKGVLNHNKRLCMQFVTFNDKTITFSYVMTGIFLHKITTINMNV